MRAVFQERYGSADALEVREIERPQPGEGEVVLEVHAAGVDRGVWHLMTGKPYAVRAAGYGITRPRQAVPGLDLAGTVVEVGKGVSRFEVGDDVFGIGIGSYAEYARAPEDKLVHKPATLSFDQAAAVAISGLTAIQAVEDVARVRPGQEVLVLGASGGVGSFAVQLAKAAGARVTGVSSGAKADFVSSLGADEVIDYATSDPTAAADTYDVIIDTGGRNGLGKLRHALTPTGTLVIVGGEDGGSFTGGTGRQLRAILLSPFVRQRLRTFVSKEHHEGVERLRSHIEAGNLTPAVSTTYPLERAADALRDLEEGRIRGKAVVRVRPG
ncbi:MAG: NAD(P)-dependent alcohol dehydrogenase [Actinomycetia bacterium]|nr:NAD(P)-dependent alcohol dehydrogenase [Actinomycetes bacterium]